MPGSLGVITPSPFFGRFDFNQALLAESTSDPSVPKQAVSTMSARHASQTQTRSHQSTGTEALSRSKRNGPNTPSASQVDVAGSQGAGSMARNVRCCLATANLS